MLGIDSSDSLPDNTMFGRLEHGTRAVAGLCGRCITIPPKPYTHTAFVAVSAVLLATDTKTAPVNGRRLGRVSTQ